MQMESKLLELKKKYSTQMMAFRNVHYQLKGRNYSLSFALEIAMHTPRVHFSSRKKSPRTSAFKQGKIQYQRPKNCKIRFP